MKSKAAATAPRRRWLKRLLWSLLGLGLALVIFHRPILRFALQRGAPAFARGSGLEISWEVGGTVLGGVEIGRAHV